MKLPLFIKQFEETPKKKRQQLFMEEIQHLISEEYNVLFDGFKPNEDFHYYKFVTEHDEYGVVEYFPKGDKIHIHKLGSDGWYDKGLRWIAENFEK